MARTCKKVAKKCKVAKVNRNNQKLDAEVLLAQEFLEATGKLSSRLTTKTEELLKQVRSRRNVSIKDFADSIRRLHLS